MSSVLAFHAVGEILLISRTSADTSLRSCREAEWKRSKLRENNRHC